MCHCRAEKDQVFTSPSLARTISTYAKVVNRLRSLTFVSLIPHPNVQTLSQLWISSSCVEKKIVKHICLSHAFFSKMVMPIDTKFGDKVGTVS